MIDALQFLPAAPEDSLLYVGSYNPLWVAVSILLSIIGSYAALFAARRIDQTTSRGYRLTWIVVSALTLGIGVWAMHFIGMLALELPCRVHYHPGITLLSILPGILAGGIALGVVWNHGQRHLPPLLASLLLGAGIGTMHYTGMAAMHLEGFIRYNPHLFALSIIVAVGLAYVALRIKEDLVCAPKRCEWLIAIILGSAVSGMHYTAMAAAYFVRGDLSRDFPHESAFTLDTLATITALTTLFVALAALVLATFSRNREITSQLRVSEERWKFALEGSGDGAWDWNPQTDVANFSRRWKEMIGYAEDEFPNTGAAWQEHLHPDDRRRVLDTLQDYFQQKTSQYRVEFRMRCKDGHWKWILARGKVVEHDLFGKPLRIMGTHTDITERKQAEDALRLHASVFNNAWEGLVITDAQANIVAINAAFTDTTGYTHEDVIGNNPRLLKSGRQDAKFYEEMWHDILHKGHWRGEIWNKKKNGEIYAEILSISEVRNDHGELTNYIAAFADVTDLKAAQQHLESLANYDPLTRLPNRRLFQDRLLQEIKKGHRSQRKVALLLIDLDNFKEVNDTLGHDKGDLLLKQAAQRIAACVREADTVARLGGDEFATILSEIEDMTVVDRIAENIITQLAASFQLDQEQAFVSASIGITFYPDDATLPEALVKNADQAMYQAKGQGKNQASYFTSSLHEAAHKRMRLINDLRAAVAQSQFVVYYQPIVELQTGAINKAEALIRWQHPVRGLVSPAEFIPVAEETGLIAEIGAWVYQQAAQQVSLWRTHLHPDFQISVNWSPVQFRSHAKVKHWSEILAQHRLPGVSIVFEITESLLLNAEQNVQDELQAFHDAGIQVALDDFGTGYSSLAYLNRFDIDFLKIDQAFVHKLSAEPNDRALVEAITVMAHTLGLKVIAEGIETTQQLDILTRAGCDFGQGYLFSKPLSASDFEQMHRSTPK